MKKRWIQGIVGLILCGSLFTVGRMTGEAEETTVRDINEQEVTLTLIPKKGTQTSTGETKSTLSKEATGSSTGSTKPKGRFPSTNEQASIGLVGIGALLLGSLCLVALRKKKQREEH